VIGSYVNEDCSIGALLEVNCETDFVARNEDFIAFAHHLARIVAFSSVTSIDALMDLEEMVKP